MVLFVSKFGNAGAAANYLGVIRWCCKIRNLSQHWDSERLKILLRGREKYTMTQMAGELHGEFALLRDPLVYSVAKFAKARKMVQFHAIHLVSWFFLGRAQSEVVPLQMGEVADPVGNIRAQEIRTWMRKRFRRVPPSDEMWRGNGT